MKALVVYYSNSGTTRTAAKKISELLHADLEEILERKHRAPLLDEQGKPLGGLGMMRAAMPVPDPPPVTAICTSGWIWL